MAQHKKHILLLAGANPKNKEWIYNLKNKLLSVYTNAISVFEYSHWGKGSEVDILEETEKLSKYLSEEGVPVIIAKSAGSLITLKACQEASLTPEKAVFIGFPIRYAQANSINYTSLLSNFDASTLYIQAEHDPMGSYQHICEMTKNLPNAKTVYIDGNDHNYKDIDELVRLIGLFHKSK